MIVLMTQYQSVGLVMKHFLKEFLKHKPQGQLLAFYSEIRQLLGNLFLPEGGRETVGSFPEDLRTDTASLSKWYLLRATYSSRSYQRLSRGSRKAGKEQGVWVSICASWL